MILIQQNDLLMLCIQEYDNGVTEKSLASLPLKLTHWFLHINASSMEWGGITKLWHESTEVGSIFSSTIK